MKVKSAIGDHMNCFANTLYALKLYQWYGTYYGDEHILLWQTKFFKPSK